MRLVHPPTTQYLKRRALSSLFPVSAAVALSCGGEGGGGEGGGGGGNGGDGDGGESCAGEGVAKEEEDADGRTQRAGRWRRRRRATKGTAGMAVASTPAFLSSMNMGQRARASDALQARWELGRARRTSLPNTSDPRVVEHANDKRQHPGLDGNVESRQKTYGIR